MIKMMTMFKPEQQLKIQILRKGREKNLIATLGKKEKPGMIKKAYMGVYLSNLNEKKAEKLGYKESYGICLDKVVDEGPSAEAGLQNGDVLMELNNEKIYTDDQLTKMLDILQPEETVKMKIFRNGKIKNYDVKLGVREFFDYKNHMLQNVTVYKYDKPKKYIGVILKELNDQLRNSFGVKNGVMIEKIQPESPAETAGLLAGDIIQEIDKKIIETIKDIHKAIQAKEIDEKINVLIKRAKDDKTIDVKIGEHKNQNNETGSFDFYFEDGDIEVITDGIQGKLLNLQTTIDGLNTMYIDADSLRKEEIFLDKEFDFDFDFDYDFEFFEESGEI